MWNKILLAFLVTALVGFLALLYNNQQTPSPLSQLRTIDPADALLVTLTPEGYEPAEFTIPVGTAVTFTTTTGKPHWPASNLHPTHEIYAAFDPLSPVDPDKSWTFIFNQEGSWNFHDHLRAYYTGTVHVVKVQE